jgi:hypothetical protein
LCVKNNLEYHEKHKNTKNTKKKHKNTENIVGIEIKPTVEHEEQAKLKFPPNSILENQIRSWID